MFCSKQGYKSYLSSCIWRNASHSIIQLVHI
uniref:Uncharacterized protein n=1 Tax=Arundo donax TaxID=35708 RepID=A0A0A9EPI7_ARUDO